MTDHVDVLVIGGGIAGACAGFHLATRARVLLVETEPVLAHHTTGRSAAQYLENYGPDQVRRLTLASRAFLEHPPAGAPSLLSPRPLLAVGREDQVDAVLAMAEQGRALVPSIREVDTAAALELCPVLRPEAAAVGVYEPDASDVDVARLHQLLVAGIRRAGSVRVAAPLVALERTGSRWTATVGETTVTSSTVVDAAGAWADRVAALAGLPQVGLLPLRRTAFTATVPAGVESRRWPLVHDVADTWYFKPEGAGQLLCSPADETPSDPVDARPDPVDVALALDRINAATTLGLRHVRTAWAGLRTFTPDRELVLGPDPLEPSFVWYAGLGGYGIQTAPAAGALVAALALDRPVPAGLVEAGVAPALLGPDRLRG